MGKLVNLLMALRYARPLFAYKFKCPMNFSDRKGEAAFLFKAINSPPTPYLKNVTQKISVLLKYPKKNFSRF